MVRPGPATAGFDRFVVVDWSAAARPRVGRDSVWIAEGARRGPVRTTNPPTRGAAHAQIVRILDAAVASGERILVGYDFSFGYPYGAAPWFARTGARWARPWAYLARHLHDTPDTNRNDRFEVADAFNASVGVAVFFGCPPGAASAHLSPTATPPAGLAPNPLAPWRRTEREARSQTGSAVLSGWHLYGGVSVGSQILTGLPHLQRLRCRYGPVLRVWPQQTGFGVTPVLDRAPPAIVLAELWPTALAPPPAPEDPMVRDERQVLDALDACRERQQGPGGLAPWFDPPSLRALGPAARRRAAEEGGILGVG